MRKKRQNHSADFKAKVAIEALKEQKKISELAQLYEIHPNLSILPSKTTRFCYVTKKRI
jgi:transposase-like protein